MMLRELSVRSDARVKASSSLVSLFKLVSSCSVAVLCSGGCSSTHPCALYWSGFDSEFDLSRCSSTWAPWTL